MTEQMIQQEEQTQESQQNLERDTIKLNNGTVIEGNLHESGGILYVYMYGLTFKQGFDLLIVPENVSSIEWSRFGETGVVTGYTTLFSSTIDDSGMISSAIKR